ncbi:DUF1638 domain-containing protein [Candidatus Formimonas warabiya]|uniref:DUF1638 domain-containing protein n=1 Tax=Formimonas warabiya TaxID=1761012 RepID=A0A3G1KXQ9_FORW1|nr:DUF1638 domain-containing protein [Candidatus Formimonas warabiya]ATW27268.1 hypothetical protein DCMF_23165 [Candidatus Formimonas warabiya]
MKIKLVGCASTMNEVKWLGVPENTDCEFLDFDLHGNPARLHDKLQQIIHDSQDYDFIILTYNRCSNVLINLVSPKVPLLLPKTHDCIGLLLGSHDRHMEFSRENSAVYYFSQGWLDYGRSPYSEYLGYLEKYGEENARSLIDTLYGRYKKAVLIITPGMKDVGHYRKKVKEIADFFGWETTEIEGDITLLAALVQGKENLDTVLVEPGVTITEELLGHNC